MEPIALFSFDSTAVEYPIIYTSELTPQTLNIKSGLSHKLMVINNDGQPGFYINKYLNLDENYAEDFSRFTGNVQTIDRDGEMVASRWYENGRFLADLKHSEAIPDSDLAQNKMQYLILETTLITDWYRYDSESGGWVYTHTTETTHREQIVLNQQNSGLYQYWNNSGMVDYSGGGGNGTDGNGGKISLEEATIKKIEDRRVFDKIDDLELKGKEKCLHDLLTKNGTNFVKDLLKNFEGKSEFDIDIKSITKLTNPITKKESGALTWPPNSDNKILIEINSSSILKKSALEAAKTILHEYIHADIFRKLHTKKNVNQEVLEFRDTYNKYKEQFNPALSHHQTMGDLYVNSMRDALKAFHKNVLKSDYAKYVRYNGHEPMDLFYEALAWRGLKEHNVEAYKDIDPEKIKQLEAVDLDIDILTKDCKDAQ